MKKATKPASLPDFTEQEAKDYIYRNYIDADSSFLNRLINYWDGKHITQIRFRQHLKEILDEESN